MLAPSQDRDGKPAPLSVAVVIASKNRPAEIVRCLEAIFRHSPSVDEVIVVDQSAEKYGLEERPLVKHIYAPELGGLTAARNRGLAAARSDIILFLDDDAELLNDAVYELRAAFRAHPGAVAVQCAIEPQRPSGLFRLRERIFERGFFDSHSLRAPVAGEVRRLNGCAMAFRAGLFSHELFDESLSGYCLGEDWEFSKRALRHGRLRMAERALVRHHESPTNRHQAARYLRDRWQNHLYFYEKLGGRNPSDRWWRVWWMLGESIAWLRNGCGLPPWGRRR